MIRYVKKVKERKKEVNDPYYGKGYFIQKVTMPPTLQWRDSEGEWHDIETVEENENGLEG